MDIDKNIESLKQRIEAQCLTAREFAGLIDVREILNSRIFRLSTIDKWISGCQHKTSQVKNGCYNFRRRDVERIATRLNILKDDLKPIVLSEKNYQHTSHETIYRFTEKHRKVLNIKNLAKWDTKEYHQFLYYYNAYRIAGKKLPIKAEKTLNPTVMGKYIEGLIDLYSIVAEIK